VSANAVTATVRRPISITDRDQGGWLSHLLVVLWVAIAVAALIPSLPYYLLPLHERPFSDLDRLFKPTGTIGHSFGYAGTFMMVIGVTGYSARKRWSVLSGVGKLRDWLHVHIFLCTLGPFLVVLHTSFKFGGLVSIAFWAMTLVVLSGVFGRYVYARIPKAVNGQFRSLTDIRRRRDQLAEEVEAALGRRLHFVDEHAAAGNALGAVVTSARLEWRARASRREILRGLAAQGVARDAIRGLSALLEEQARAERQIALLAPFQRLFRYWHVFHLPFAIVMLMILAVHIAVAIAFGYGLPF